MGQWGAGRRSKYRAKPTVVDGIRFASKKEAKRYEILVLLARAGEIADLELQPRYPLRVNGFLVTTYVADFRYRERRDGQWVKVVEDVKGFRTREYNIKRKLMRAIHDIRIRET